MINFQGSATDPEDGSLPAVRRSRWQINLQHCIGTSCHIHFFMTRPGAGGSFTVPDHGDMYHFDLTLTATDSCRRYRGSTTVSIHPRTVNSRWRRIPTGLQVVDGGTQRDRAVHDDAGAGCHGHDHRSVAAGRRDVLVLVGRRGTAAQRHAGHHGRHLHRQRSRRPQLLSVTSVSPADGATGVAASSNVTATFSADVESVDADRARRSRCKQGATAGARRALLQRGDTDGDARPERRACRRALTYTATVVGRRERGQGHVGEHARRLEGLDVHGRRRRRPHDQLPERSDLDVRPRTAGGRSSKDLSNGDQAAGDGQTITLNGVTYAKGLGTPRRRRRPLRALRLHPLPGRRRPRRRGRRQRLRRLPGLPRRDARSTTAA